MEPGEEGLPYGLQRWDCIWVSDVEQAAICFEGKLRLPVGENLRVAWSFNLGDDCNSTIGTALLDVIQITSVIGLVWMSIKALDRRIIRSWSESWILSSISGVVFGIVDKIITQVQMEGILLEEREIGT